MAKFKEELPTELMAELDELEVATTKMIGDMTKAGADVVYKNVVNNLSKVFKSTDRLKNCLYITKTYFTPSDDGINNKVYFYGYLAGSVGKKLSYTKGDKKYTYYNGTPAPLVAMAREYGTSRGEKKKPFFRKSFKKQDIESAMKKVQDKYIKGE